MEERDMDIPYRFGTMIEIPRAALTAGELAEICQQLQASVQAQNLGRASERLMELENRFALVKGKLNELLK